MFAGVGVREYITAIQNSRWSVQFSFTFHLNRDRFGYVMSLFLNCRVLKTTNIINNTSTTYAVPRRNYMQSHKTVNIPVTQRYRKHALVSHYQAPDTPGAFRTFVLSTEIQWEILDSVYLVQDVRLRCHLACARTNRRNCAASAFDSVQYSMPYSSPNSGWMAGACDAQPALLLVHTESVLISTKNVHVLK